MSMPQHFDIAIISDRYPGGSELAASAAAVLRGTGDSGGIQPSFTATSTFSGCRLSLSRAGVSRALMIAEPVWMPLLNPKEIDLWLALDDKGEASARLMIEKDGPAPGGFYRIVFPDPVVPCGLALPDPPLDEKFEPWLEMLTELLAPWRTRIWNAFSDSS